MKALTNILEGIEYELVKGDVSVMVNKLRSDSRQVAENDLFIAIPGLKVDGHRFIKCAIDAGAKTIIAEHFDLDCPDEITLIKVTDSKSLLGLIASNYFGNPSSKINVIGVTGTNGKTTIATLLYRLIEKLGHKAGLISTIEYLIDQKKIPATHTTPDAIQIQHLLYKMVEAGCKYCFMEVSSHAIDQKRIAGINFDGGIFTNITHDHLDYHPTFSSYLKTKKLFFDQLPENSFALTNLDEKNGMVMIQNTKALIKTYALKSLADFKGKVLEKHLDGLLLIIDNKAVWIQFSGIFNAYNLLAVYATAMLLGEEVGPVLAIISQLKPVEGRFEIIRSHNGKYGIIDYAHTPDAIKNVLDGISEIRTGKKRVITVIGAGGDRDKTKRPIMAKEAVAKSDLVILTSDNPRNERPEMIIADMEKGVDLSQKNKVISIVDRREAIKTACLMAKAGDIILIAGKGHEDYQEINGVKHHFNDKEVLNDIFNSKEN